jgi:hypothetical protein
MYSLESIKSFARLCENYGRTEDVVSEMYAVIVFPYWFAEWGSRGIEQTRANNEAIFQVISDAMHSENLGNKTAAVSAGLNGVHASGEMTDYMDFDKHILEQMTEGSFIEKANKQLREHGFQI